MMNKRREFISTFRITRMIVFNVSYYTLGSNKTPHFTTSASVFTRNKRDYTQCGQCQKDVLPKGSVARKFFMKWDEKHLSDLNDSEYDELMKDMEELKEEYLHIYKERDTFRNQNSNIPFYEVKELSMMK